MSLLKHLAVAVLAATSLSAATCPGRGSRDTMLVSQSWLAAHLNDPNLVILAVGPKAEFEKGHIAGAVSLELAAISAKGVPLTLELPPMAELAETFAALGVSNDSQIVLYSVANSVQSATRVFLTLDAMGLGKNAALLDGGPTAWTAGGHALTTETKPAKRGKVEPCAQNDIIVDAQYVNQNRGQAGVGIVDARLPGFYTGEQIPNGQRAGHVPGAVNIPFSSVFDEKGALKPAEELAKMLGGAGIGASDRVVSYCHIGQQATVIYFVARYLGRDARLYDGSWQDWSAHTEFPATTGSKP